MPRGRCVTRENRARHYRLVALVLARRLALLEGLQATVLGYDAGWTLGSRPEPACGPGLGCAWAILVEHASSSQWSPSPTSAAVARPLGVAWESSLGPPTLTPAPPPAHPLDPLAPSEDNAIVTIPARWHHHLVIVRIPCAAQCTWLGVTAHADLAPVTVAPDDWQTMTYLCANLGAYPVDTLLGTISTRAAEIAPDWWFDRNA